MVCCTAHPTSAELVELASCQFQYYVGAGSWWAVLWDGMGS
ncbi:MULTISPECIES: hypothetical protein [unclassified Moorena]|nr:MULTISPECIES: hypothetical protein [unclassified Moorena]